MSWKLTLKLFTLFTFLSWNLAGQGCGEMFFDSGGEFGNYQNNELNEWTFCPDNPGDLVTLSFTFVDVESCCDVINIYNGTGIGELLFADLENPETFSSTAADGCLTMTWDSDVSVINGGWAANITCNPPPPCPNPTNLGVNTITSAGATITWAQVGAVTSWDIEIVESGTPTTGTPTETGVTSPFAWTGGASGTSYDAYIRGNCDDLPGETTDWVGPVSFLTVPGCGDFFFDPGGQNGFYDNQENETYTFCPDNPGDLVTINFTFVDVEGCCDPLAVYNGVGTAIPLNLDIEAPETFTSSSADGCLTVTFTTDFSVTREGWEALITCNPPPPCPNPTLLTTYDATSSGVTIEWAQVGAVTSWELEIVPAGTPATGVPTVTNVTMNPFVWMDGDSGTAYDVYVRGLCDDLPGEFTNWVGPADFTTIPTCGDQFYDPGGPNGNYDPGLFELYTFCPENAGEAIILDFTFVQLGFGDALAIYDGEDNTAPFINNVFEPGIYIASSTSGCLTVEFISGTFGGNAEGWAATVACSPCIPENLILSPDVSVTFFDNNSADILLDIVGNQDYQIEYDTVGFPFGTGMQTVNNSPMLTLENLAEGTDYEFYITNLCPDGQPSLTVGPFFFSTIYSVDVGITQLIDPMTDCGFGGGEPIRVGITNFGSLPQTLIPLNYSINGQPSGVSQPTDGFFTGIVSRDSTEAFEFDIEYNFNLPGEYTVLVWTELQNDSDFSNDTFEIVIRRFAPPFFEDFEAGEVPDFLTTNATTNLFAPLSHNNESWNLASNLFGSGFNEFQLDLPVMGPMGENDTLFFDYRMVDWSAGATATTDLGEDDLLFVLASIDCGETFDTIYQQNGLEHEPSIEYQTLAIPLEALAGENVQLRIFGQHLSGPADYWLDIDNINIPRCDGLAFTAEVSDSEIGANNGSIDITTFGGIEPIEIEWNNGLNGAFINNLTPGEYTLNATDRFGCTGTFTVFVDEVVNTFTPTEVITELVLAPNPTRDLTMVRANFSESVDAHVQIVNLMGQRVWQSPILKAVTTLEQTVDMSQLPAGIYLVQVGAAGQWQTTKLVKTE